MAYTTNPYLPRVRMQAVILVKKQGWTVRKTARYIGVSPGTVSKWCARAPDRLDARCGIYTRSSKPKTVPGKIPWEIEQLIINERKRTGRCGQVIHHVLQKQGVSVSLSTVHRVLDRQGLTKKYSPWKRRHVCLPRPNIANPGDLVEIDTIHEMKTKNSRMYVYSLIDIFSRWTYAWASERINTWQSLTFVGMAQKQAVFNFNCIQSDHGQEFSKYFSNTVGVEHRHSRVRKPNDNGHVERFNRTLREECLFGLPKTVYHYNEALKQYLEYYNTERPHMGINYLTPLEKLREVFPRL